MALAAGNALADDAERHQKWQDILTAYVVEAPDGVNRFDYGGLKDTDEDVAKLDAYLASFEDMNFDTLTRDEQFAAWSNVYNALTVKHIIGRYPLRSIRSGYIVGPWKRVKTTVNGREISLDSIENKVLRVEFDDPRLHYAINCASYGCPNLRKAAWVADTLEQDLDAAARDFINHPRAVSIRPRGGLEVSTIYKWFKEDFGGSEERVIAHLLDYANPILAEQIRANADIKKHAYDWSLNDATDTEG
ncbi:MAG: DUF547 domain-containing protein [Henriciella sp.]